MNVTGVILRAAVASILLVALTPAVAQSNTLPFSEALVRLTEHAFNGFIQDRGHRVSQVAGMTSYDMAFTIAGLTECQIRVEGAPSPDDVAICKGYTGHDPSLAAASFSDLLAQLSEFVGKSHYIYVAETREGASNLKRAEYFTDNNALIAIELTTRDNAFDITVSVSPVFSL